MNQINEFFGQAELAQAAYATLNTGEPSQSELLKVGMTLTQAQNFADNWRVIDQYDGVVEQTYVDEFGQEQTFLNPTGLSATVFEDVGTGKRYLAIRGTEPSDLSDIFTDIIDIGLLGTDKYQKQYAALSAQVQKWMDDGVLQSGFTVTGHSLGGFLATNLALNYSADVSHTYLYNAPGVTGVGGNLLEAIVNALSPGNPVAIPAVLSISNIVATRDVVSEVGLSISPPIVLAVESQSPLGAHSIAGVTDTLAVYNLFATVDTSLGVEAIGGILDASSNNANTTFESAISALGALYGKSYPATVTSRDTLYTNIYDLESAIAKKRGSGLKDCKFLN